MKYCLNFTHNAVTMYNENKTAYILLGPFIQKSKQEWDYENKMVTRNCGN
jgi:hypothetical protein